MRQIKLIILTLLLIYSCKDNPTNNNKSHNDIDSKGSITDSLNQIIVKTSDNEPILKSALPGLFLKAIKAFPNDSLSLYRFYFKSNPAKDQETLKKQIKRLEALTSKESIEKYRRIEKNLKPLMTKIVNSESISKSQSDSLVLLYSDYDYFSGESLFSQLLTNDENYKLVWQSFRIMVKESIKDTCFISGLIILENNIRTNAELSEAMGDFVVKAIRNNPTGFLDMYSQRQAGQRTNFANYIAVWDEPDKELIDKYSEISKNSTNKNYRQLATELIEKYKN